MVRLGQAQMAALPQRAAETVSRLSEAILGGDKAEIASGLQRHLAPAVAHFSVSRFELQRPHSLPQPQ